MLALAFECAGQGLHAALAEDGVLLATKEADMDRGQPAAVLPLLQQLLEDAGKTPQALDRLGVTRGPGGFTGIRLGLSVALGLCRATGAAFYGLNAFDVYAQADAETQAQAQAQTQAETLAEGPGLGIAIDSRRHELFFRGYDASGLAPRGDEVCAPEQLQDRQIRRFVGSAATRLDPAAVDLAPSMAFVAQKLSEPILTDDWLLQARDQSTPLYLREPDIGSPKAK